MAKLTVETGPSQGATIALSRDSSCTIGTDAGCDLQLAAPGIASHHLVIKALKGAGFGVKCLEGTCTLNERPIEAARLSPGDLLEIGGVKLRFGEADVKPAAGEAQQLAGFRLLRVLGQGGMGTVYQAEQVSLHREVALKVLSKDLTRDPVFVARFVAEARAAARLHHPHVVQVFDVGHDGDTYYYSMELMHEGSLEQRLRARGKLAVDEALSVIADAARGLAYAESLRIVHRDIKPDNLMLDQHGHVKIADLGLALTDEDDVSKVIGTPHFMSPEQALGKPLDHRSDLYSLGCTCYRLLTGRVPFKRDSVKEILRAHVKDPPEPVHKLCPEIPAEVAAIVARLLEKDPQARYQKADELLAELEAVLAPPARKGVWIGLAGLAVVVAGGALAWGLTRPEGRTETKIVTESDPRVAAALEAVRQKDAEIARLGALLSGLEGLGLAEALEKVVAEHGGTAAAVQASARAQELRRELQRAAEAHAAHAARVQQAREQLGGQVRPLVAAGEYRRAAELLTLAGVPAELSAEPSMAQAVEELRAELRQHATQALTRLRAAVDEAKHQRDPAALGLALTALERIADAKSGWPEVALPAAGEVVAEVEAGRRAAHDLEAQLEAERMAATWASYRQALLAPDGVLAAADRLELARAARLARGAGEALAASNAGGHALALADSLTRAQAFLDRFTQAAGEGQMTLALEGGADDTPEPAPVTAFAPGGPKPGLTIKVGPALRPRSQLVPLAELRGARLAEVFRLPEASGIDLDRAAFLAWIGLADHVAAAREYLSRVARGQGSSGTGEQAYRGDLEVLLEAGQVLGAIQEPWAQALGEELSAGQLLARALRALSAHQNLSAAGHLDALLQSFARSLVVMALEP